MSLKTYFKVDQFNGGGSRYGINQKTVAKWKRRAFVADLPTGPKDARSTVLTAEQEAIKRKNLQFQRLR